MNANKLFTPTGCSSILNATCGSCPCVDVKTIHLTAEPELNCDFEDVK